MLRNEDLLEHRGNVVRTPIYQRQGRESEAGRAIRGENIKITLRSSQGEREKSKREREVREESERRAEAP
jgi:hypothetical protein